MNVPRRGRRREIDPTIVEAEDLVRLAIAAEIEAECELLAWNQATAADQAGVQANTLSDLLRAKRSPDLTSLVRLASAFGKRLVIRFEDQAS